jgi:hypothetical protein
MAVYKNISGERKLIPGPEGKRFEVMPGDIFHAGRGLPSCYFKELKEEDAKGVGMYKAAPSGRRPKRTSEKLKTLLKIEEKEENGKT